MDLSVTCSQMKSVISGELRESFEHVNTQWQAGTVLPVNGIALGNKESVPIVFHYQAAVKTRHNEEKLPYIVLVLRTLLKENPRTIPLAIVVLGGGGWQQQDYFLSAAFRQDMPVPNNLLLFTEQRFRSHIQENSPLIQGIRTIV